MVLKERQIHHPKMDDIEDIFLTKALYDFWMISLPQISLCVKLPRKIERQVVGRIRAHLRAKPL